MPEFKRIVFMGTPHFAWRILECLCDHGYNVIGVVTQPDKPVGRKQVLTPSEVKIAAMGKNIPVLQPARIRKEYQEVLDLDPDLIVTCAYGQIIPRQILEHCLCINVHASLLPKFRGGAPMQRAIMEHEKTTGITIMEMSEAMDAGDMIMQKEVLIEDTDTLTSLENKLIECACPLLIETLKALEEGSAVFTKQKEEEVSFAPIIRKEEEKLLVSDKAEVFFDKARALIEEPYGWLMLPDGSKIKICSLRLSDKETDAENGAVLGLMDKAMAIAVDGRVVLIDELIPEGRKRMSARDYLNGAGRNLIGGKLS